MVAFSAFGLAVGDTGPTGPAGATGPQGLRGPAGSGACEPSELLLSDSYGNIFLMDTVTIDMKAYITTSSDSLYQWAIAANNANRSIYAVENATLVRVYNADDGSETAVVDNFPQGGVVSVAADPCQNLWYAASETENAVYILEGMTNQIIRTIPLNSNQFTVLGSTMLLPVACRRKMFLSQDQTIAMLDLEIGEIEKTFPLGQSTSVHAYDPNNCLLYAGSSDYVYVIDPISGTVSDFYAYGSVEQIAFNTRLNVFYVQSGETIRMYNAATNEELRQEYFEGLQGVVYDAPTDRLIAVQAGIMQLLDPVTLQILDSYGLPGSGYYSAVQLIKRCACSCNNCFVPSCTCGSECSNMAYALKDNILKFVNQNTGSVTNTIELPYYGYAIDYCPVNPEIYSTAGGGVLLIASDGGILVYDAVTGEELGSFFTTTSLRAVIYNPASNLIFAADQSHVFSFDPDYYQSIDNIIMSGAHNGIPVLVQDPTYPYVFATDGTTGTISVWPGIDNPLYMSSSYDITQLTLDTAKKLLYVYSTTNNTFRGISYAPDDFNDIIINTTVSRRPESLEFNDASGLIYANSVIPYPRVLMAIEPESGGTVFSEDFYNDITGLSIDNTANRIFYSYDNQLRILDGTTRAVLYEIPDVEANDIAFAVLNCQFPGGSGLSAPRIPAIPLPDIQVATNENGERWLRAKLHGSPLPGDRLYLRRLSRSGPKKGTAGSSVRRMAHPENPPGEEGGSLPKHLKNSAYFSGGNYWHKRAACTCHGTPLPSAEYFRTEWALSTPDETIWLMPLDDFLGLFHGQRLAAGGNRQYYLAIDFVAVRPDKKHRYASYGPPSRLLRIYRKHGDCWGVSFI